MSLAQDHEFAESIATEAGELYEWDSAAPVAVAVAAGLYVLRLDGSPLVYNPPDPWLPDLFISHSDIADEVLQALARIGLPMTSER